MSTNELVFDETFMARMREAIFDGATARLKDAFGGYNSPFNKMVEHLALDAARRFQPLFASVLDELVTDEEFRAAVRAKMIRELTSAMVSNADSELKKRVGELMRDPVTRAKITLAVKAQVDALTRGGE